MQVYEGIVRNQVIVLSKGIQLDEGSRVEVRIPETVGGPSESLYKQRLVEAGLMQELKGPNVPEPGETRMPLQLGGQPLSETIISERR